METWQICNNELGKGRGHLENGKQGKNKIEVTTHTYAHINHLRATE